MDALKQAAEKAADFRERGDWSAYRGHVDWARRAYGRQAFDAAEREVSSERQASKRPTYFK